MRALQIIIAGLLLSMATGIVCEKMLGGRGIYIAVPLAILIGWAGQKLVRRA